MKQESQNKFSLKGYIKSFKCAISGLNYAVKNERNIIVILTAILLTTIMGFIFRIRIYEWLFCIMMFSSVLATELINTAIEKTVDIKVKEYNEFAKIAKDVSSSATLVFSAFSLVGGLIIFLPKILELI